MDKEWVFLDHRSAEYMAGLHAFIDNSLLVAGFQGKIKCPCTECYNRFWTLPKDVENHLKYDGMAVYYLHAPWKWHGEPLPGANMGEPPAPNGDIPAMLHDAFGMHGLSPGPNDDEEFAPPQGLPPDAERFYRLMEEGQTELYPGCGKTKLEFILQLYHLKALNCWTDVSFSDFRFSCGNKHVHPDQWLALVAKWDGAHNQEVAGTNTENRQQLKMPHATGTKTFAQLRYEWELEHPGEVLDRVTFLTLVYTSKKKDPKNPQPINEEAQKKFDELRELEQVVQDEGREITTEIRNELFHKVMGPEKRNRVRGYGVGVNWSDIPGIVTEKTGITAKIQALKDVYEAQREAFEKREAEMAKQLKEAAEREEALKENCVALNRKMDAIQGQVRANSLVQILAAAGIGSMESLDFG